MSDDEDLTGRLRAGLAREGAAVVPHADVADLTDRIATRSRRNQRVLSVAAAVLLIAGVATGIAVGRNTGGHTTTQTAATQPDGGVQGPVPGASSGAKSMMAGPELAPGPLTRVLTRTANGVTLRVYAVGSSTVGGPIEPQASGPASTVPAPCTVTSDTFQVEASTDDVAASQTFGTTLTGSSTTATEQVVGVAEGHPFVVVLVRGTTTDQRVTATMGAATDTATATTVPGGAGWVTALALPLAPGATSLSTSIGVNTFTAGVFPEGAHPMLTLTEQAPTATTPIPNGQNCGSPTPTTHPGSGECLKLQVPGASTSSCPKTTLPPTCTYVNPGGPAETVKPGNAVPVAPGDTCACATNTTAICSVPSCPATPATAPCPLAPACRPDTTCTPTPEPGVAGGGSGSSSGSSGSTSSGSTGPVN
jgi:hypothetical protein